MRKWLYEPGTDVDYLYIPSDANHPNNMGAYDPDEIPPMSFLPNTGQWYLAASDIWIENDINTLPQNASSFTKFSQLQDDYPDPYFEANCITIGQRRTVFSQLNPERVYFATGVRIPNDPNHPCFPFTRPALFASHVDPLTGMMYPQTSSERRFVQLPYPPGYDIEPVAISGLAVDAQDPLHIYVGFSGYEPGMKVWEAHIDPVDPTVVAWSNMDPDLELPNIPINDLVFQEGTDGGLYVAMDMGVYYRNATTSWQPFFEDLPNVDVSDLDINYCSGKLRAGTTGRALWESDLAERPTVERAVAANTTWDFHRNLGQTVRVTNGATLTISNTVNFAPHTRLIIDPGAKVVVQNGGKLTNLCGEAWDGVEVRGNATLSQAPYSNQGYLVLEAGAIIEYADIAVRLFGSDANNVADPATTGGVLRSLGTAALPVLIRECKEGVWAKDYDHFNRTHINYTTFTRSTEGGGSHVRLEGVRGVIVQHCDLEYTGTYTPWVTLRPTGIRAFNSRFTASSSEFRHLTRAMFVSSTDGFSPCYVRNNTVAQNERGIYLLNVDYAEVTDNLFNVPEGHGPLQVPYGLYLGGCSGYEVEENAFMGIGHPTFNVGIVVRNSNDGPTEFYRNSFDRLEVGSLLQGDNRLEDQLDNGLQFRCNTYGTTSACTYDVALTEGGEVAENQGSQTNPAGNRFYPECPGTDETDIFVDQVEAPPTGFNYHHNTNDFTTPLCITALFVENVETGDVFTLGNGSGATCPEVRSRLEDRNLQRAAYFGLAEDVEALRFAYDGGVNGGDTEFLMDLIEDENVGSFNLRNALLASSPDLSDRVMVAAIERVAEMTDLHLAQVLLANCPLNPDVGIALKSHPLEQLYMDLIDGQQGGGMTWKSLVEMELSALRANADRARTDFARLCLTADSTGSPVDSIAPLLAEESYPASGAAQVHALLAQHAWSTVADRLADPGTYDLLEDEAVVFDLLLTIAQNPQQAASEVMNALVDLREFAGDKRYPTHEIAQALLTQFAASSYPEPVVLPRENRLARPESSSAPALEELEMISLAPNPANDRVLVVTHLPSTARTLTLLVTTNQGGVQLRQAIRPGAQITEIPTRSWANGVYRVNVLVDGDALDGTSLTIAH